MTGPTRIVGLVTLTGGSPTEEPPLEQVQGALTEAQEAVVAVELVVTRYQSQVTNELEQWGYKVVAH